VGRKLRVENASAIYHVTNSESIRERVAETGGKRSSSWSSGVSWSPWVGRMDAMCLPNLSTRTEWAGPTKWLALPHQQTSHT
jgi:hypothetical protein